jgi:hypothetical protein
MAGGGVNSPRSIQFEATGIINPVNYFAYLIEIALFFERIGAGSRRMRTRLPTCLSIGLGAFLEVALLRTMVTVSFFPRPPVAGST